MDASTEFKKFQYKMRACALFSQLPDDDMQGAREVVLFFLEMAEAYGLLVREDREAIGLACDAFARLVSESRTMVAAARGAVGDSAIISLGGRRGLT
jgi:hypothetical protein